MVNIISHNHTPLRFVSLLACFCLCYNTHLRMCFGPFMHAHTCMHRFINTQRGFVLKRSVLCVHVCIPPCYSLGLSVLKWQCLISVAPLCPWFGYFLLIITNMGWNIWVTEIDIMTECALLSSSYIRLANFWGKAKCLGNITSHWSSPSH